MIYKRPPRYCDSSRIVGSRNQQEEHRQERIAKQVPDGHERQELIEDCLFSINPSKNAK